jgi:hypothetical protein
MVSRLFLGSLKYIISLIADIGKMKLRRIRWAGHVDFMGQKMNV